MAPDRLRHIATLCLGVLIGGLVVWGIVGGGGKVRSVAPIRQPFPPPSAFGGPRQPEVKPAVAPAASDDPAEAPPGTLHALLLRGTDFEQTATLYDLASQASTDELERLIAEAGQLPGGVDRRAALSILYSRYADLDPAGALDYLLASDSLYDDVAVRAIFHTWGRTDLDAAVARAVALEPRLRGQAGHVILLARDDLGFDRQREIAERLEISGVLSQVVARQTMDDATGNPQADWESAVAGASGTPRTERLAGIAQAWVRQDPLAAMNAVMSLRNGQLRWQLQQQLMWTWSQRSPRDAVDWTLTQPPGAQRAELTGVALRGLAQADPRGALELAQSLPGGDREEAASGVFAAWSESDSAAAAAALETVTDQRVRNEALTQIAMNYLRQDPDGAVAWLQTLDEAEVLRAGSMVMAITSQEDPVAASELVARLPAALQSQAAQSVVNSWARRDPQAAAAWIERAPPAADSAALTTVLVQQWARYDRSAALRYADRIRNRADRDQALVSIISSQRGGDVSLAESLYDDLRTDASRRQAAQFLYYALHETDPARAERYAWAARERRQ